ncbi:conserved hypothetical protein [Ureaplasma urealyticum serovar 11 str. ATCC 33695]|uniref:lipoprotein signal peptidase n=1 Tax=Ureaplasma urealyticum TaxID=2130 RepID=UPI0001750400|nr:lipoprotein signal peptidase [Ureaplasma urealyticum]EDU66938.1 conserved hypothetical protein [Ureaplasma urealyticum serovar 11 str. ATCC 33695]UNT66510.1 lipoprotein signal peptidase [Ureaplasma urealyticum]
MFEKITNSSFYITIKKFNESLRKINFFKKIILKIDNKGVRDYFLSITTLDVIFYKIINFIIIALIVLLSGFLVREWAINLVINTKEIYHGPIFHFTLNNGIALGRINNNSGIVYALQSIPIILGFLSFIFLKKSYHYAPLLFLLFGGLGNIIDRSIPELELYKALPDIFHNSLINPNSVGGGNDVINGVVDYWKFVNSIINLFDVYIVVGVCVLVVILIIGFIIKWKSDNDTKDTTKKAADENDLEINEVSNKPFGYDDLEKP